MNRGGSEEMVLACPLVHKGEGRERLLRVGERGKVDADIVGAVRGVWKLSSFGAVVP